MKIFIDTADIDEIREAFSWGIVDGVTTNPSLINKAVKLLKANGKEIDMDGYIREILRTARGYPVSLEVIGVTAKDMYDEARKLHGKFNQIANNVAIKIPINPASEEVANFDGLKVIGSLSEEGIPVNVTLVMSVEQALLAAKLGAKYVSPFAGRTDDLLRERLGWRLVKEKPNEREFTKDDYYPANGVKADDGEIINDNGVVSGIDLIRQIKEVYDRYNFKSEIISASIRNTRQVVEAARIGAHIATIPFPVLEKMLIHPKTAEGMRKFTADVVPEYREIFE
ncbi:transaldolase [Candidatus Woesearchaeota archaeon CG08_land_8_20_14_0_20_47_9]|nr:MAG: transaldolase [Candidatus Woesearchaeota archaeon CG1_02_47_18]PIO03613.1 MAG: transaldolase [Candidatus Woesearchaeota archaeon CG08_land_8_20_14_0_20_47_9]